VAWSALVLFFGAFLGYETPSVVVLVSLQVALALLVPGILIGSNSPWWQAPVTGFLVGLGVAVVTWIWILAGGLMSVYQELLPPQVGGVVAAVTLMTPVSTPAIAVAASLLWGPRRLVLRRGAVEGSRTSSPLREQ
jgi:hypothetical protein